MNNTLRQKLISLNNNVKIVNGREYFCTFKVGASEQEIDSLNSIFDYYRIPYDYIELLSFSNGFTLYNIHDISGFIFFGTDQIKKENDIFKETFEKLLDENIIIFCSILGEGNFIGFKVLNNDNYEILDCFHEELPENWNKITDSLEDFLTNLIRTEGDLYWLNN